MDSDQISDSSIEVSNGTAMEPYSFSSDDASYDSRRGFKRHRSSNDTSRSKEKAQEDRISALPNSLILHILSFLQTNYATRTSTLSKRWNHLWTFVPVLNFHDPKNYYGSKCLNRFVMSIHRTLILHQSPKIEKFLLKLDYRRAFASDVDVWLRIAARKNVEELDLTFCPMYPYSDDDDDVDEDEFGNYVLALNVFSISSLVTLRLKNCEIGHPGIIRWKSLKVLWLSEMSLSNDLIRDILSGSPSLELLELHHCRQFDFLDIKSERLRKLVINVYENNSELKISAPNVRSLNISGYLKTHKLSLVNSSSLVDATLDFALPCETPGSYCIPEKYSKILKELFQNIRHVNYLTVGSCFLEILSVLKEKDVPCQLSARVCLTIETQLSDWELPGIRRLLELTPLLKTLVIKMTSGIYEIACGSVFQESLCSSQMSFFMLTLLNLTTVKIIDFLATEREMELILFLLKNTRLLEKMIICTRKPEHRYVSVKKSLKVARRLLRSPKCSPNAIVLFS